MWLRLTLSIGRLLPALLTVLVLFPSMLTAEEPLPGDVCSDAVELVVDEFMIGTVDGYAATVIVPEGCAFQELSGPDHFYKITVDPINDYHLFLTLFSNADLAMVLWEDCPGDDDLCIMAADVPGGGVSESASYIPDSSGTLFIQVLDPHGAGLRGDTDYTILVEAYLICVDGAEDCPCEDGECDSGLYCNNEDTCVACVEGLKGCSCSQEGICNEDLACSDFVCVDCPWGSDGCPCEDEVCDDQHLCIDDICYLCPDGTKNCPCDEGSCEGNLICNDDDFCEFVPDGDMDPDEDDDEEGAEGEDDAEVDEDAELEAGDEDEDADPEMLEDGDVEDDPDNEVDGDLIVPLDGDEEVEEEEEETGADGDVTDPEGGGGCSCRQSSPPAMPLLIMLLLLGTALHRRHAWFRDF